MRKREQSGYIYQRGGWWVLRYREDVMDNGQLRRRHLAKQIEPVAPEHRRLKRPPPEIEKRAGQLLTPLNNHTTKPESTQTLVEFVEGVYFTNLEKDGPSIDGKGIQGPMGISAKRTV